MSAMFFNMSPGEVIFERDGFKYEFQEYLGEGPNGICLMVARRRTVVGNHPRGKVLLKALVVGNEQETARVKRARAKLQEQVRLASYLDHPGILRVEGLQKTPGVWYVITAHPAGHNLCDLLTIVSECRRWFPPLFAMHVGARSADALAHAHEAKDDQGNPLNIVHRAVDIEHISVDWMGTVHVSDFGLSLSSLPGRVASSVRRPHGDTYYAAPETLLTGQADARSDLFTLGVVMLELATGKNLLDAPDDLSEDVKASVSKRMLRKVRHAIRRARLAGRDDYRTEDVIWRAATYTQADVESLTAKLPEALRLPLRKLLQRSRTDRYQSAQELAADLDRGLKDGAGYGRVEAAQEIADIAKEASEAMIELGLRSPRRFARTLSEASTA